MILKCIHLPTPFGEIVFRNSSGGGGRRNILYLTHVGERYRPLGIHICKFFGDENLKVNYFIGSTEDDEVQGAFLPSNLFEIEDHKFDTRWEIIQLNDNMIFMGVPILKNLEVLHDKIALQDTETIDVIVEESKL